ncbi:MAG: CvpA family protein [Chloroflexota bacterium]
MILNFTEIALSVVVVFGLLGWLRGARRAAATTGGVFFSMTVVSLTGPNILSFLARSGLTFHPKEDGDLFLALLFVFTVYIVQLTVKRAILAGKEGPPSRQQRLTGLVLGFLNGFLLVANVVRYADPYLRKATDNNTGGWTWETPFPHLTHVNGNSITLALGPTPVTITPSPLLQIYSTLPTALILLFGFLSFVFVGTVYGRVVHGRR